MDSFGIASYYPQSSQHIKSIILKNKVPPRDDAILSLEVGAFNQFMILSASFMLTDEFSAPLLIESPITQIYQFYNSISLHGGCVSHMNTENFISVDVSLDNPNLQFSISNYASFGGYELIGIFLVICFV